MILLSNNNLKTTISKIYNVTLYDLCVNQVYIYARNVSVITNGAIFRFEIRLIAYYNPFPMQNVFALNNMT